MARSQKPDRFEIPVVGPAYKSKELELSAQVTKNLFPEINREARSVVALHNTAGLKVFSTVEAKDRGMHDFHGFMHVVNGTSLWSIDASGVNHHLGTVEGTGRCVMADDGTQLVIVSDGIAYIYTEADGLQLITDPDLVEPTSVAYLNSIFVFDQNRGTFGEWVSSELLTTGFNVAELDFAQAEGHPDDIVRVFSFKQLIYFFGSKSIEPWYNSGEGNPPFDRVTGGVVPYGLAGTHAVVSTSEYMYFLDDKRIPRRSSGLDFQNIGNNALGVEFSKYGTISDAIAFTFIQDNQVFFALTFPTEDRTWCFHEPSGSWFQLSYGVNDARHRASSMLHIYGLNFCADHSNGLIYHYDPCHYTDNGAPIQRRRDTALIHGGLFQEPGRRMFIEEIEFIVGAGPCQVRGTGMGAQPQPPAEKVGGIYTLFMGTRSGSEVIDYCHFDGATITNMAQLGYIVGLSGDSVEGFYAVPTNDGGVAGLVGGGVLNNYVYTAESGGYFFLTYGRENDFDELDVGSKSGQIMPIRDKMIIGASSSGIPTMGVNEVSNALEKYQDVPPNVPGEYVATDSAHLFCWHNDYLIAYDWTNGTPWDNGRGDEPEDLDRYEDSIRAYSVEVDGTDLTNIDEETGMHPVLVPWDRTTRIASDGNYIYESCLYNYAGSGPGAIWDLPAYGWHAGIQAMTFDGATFEHVIISSDGLENQVPWYGSAVPGTDEYGTAGVVSMVTGNGYIFVLGWHDNLGPSGVAEYKLWSYTFDEVNYFTEIDTLVLPVDTDAFEILFEPTNNWLVVDSEGVWDVSDGTFNNKIVSGSFTPTLDLSTALKGQRGGWLFTTPLNDAALSTRHSTVTARGLMNDYPYQWFDFQDTLLTEDNHVGPPAIYAIGARSEWQNYDWDRNLLVADTPASVTKISPIRKGMQQAVKLNGTFMEDQGTSQVSLTYSNDNESTTIFTIGCTGPVTQMAAFHCRDASDQTWSSYFSGSDLVLEFNSTIDEVLTFTLTGLADGELHVVAIRLIEDTGDIEVQYDDTAYTTKTWTGAVRLKEVTKTFMFGGDTTWATQVSDGVFTDLFMVWDNDVQTRAKLDGLVAQIYAEILAGPTAYVPPVDTGVGPVYPPPGTDPENEIVAPFWENTGNWIDLTKLDTTTYAAMFGVTVESTDFNSVFAVDKAALVNTSDTGNRLQIQDSSDCANAALYITDSSGNVVDSMIYAGIPNGDSVLIPTGANYYVVIVSDTGNAKIKKWDSVVPIVDTTGSVPWSWLFGTDLQFDTSRSYLIPATVKIIPAEGIAVRFTAPLSGSFSMNLWGPIDVPGVFGTKRKACNQTVLDFTTPPVQVVTVLNESLIVGMNRSGLDLELAPGETYFFNIINDEPGTTVYGNQINVKCTVSVY